jgi:hypothetical protein
MMRAQRCCGALLAVGVIAGLLLTGCAEAPAAPAPPTVAPVKSPTAGRILTPTPGQAEPQAVVQAKTDLAKRTGIAVNDIKTRSVEAVNWPDASLGCPQPDMMYAQVVTPGQRIVLEAGGQTYEYHSGGTNVVFCPPHAERK